VKESMQSPLFKDIYLKKK